MNKNDDMSLPKVSVIIPIYKVEKYIEKCARSLFKQTLKEIEFIFVDDCSPDNSVAVLLSVLEEFPSRKKNVKIVRHEINKGLTNARNTGLSFATGEFIAHCDSDDWVHSDMYLMLYQEAIKSRSDVVLCDIYMVEKEHITIFNTAKIGFDNTETINNYITLPWTCTVNMIVNHDIYNERKILSPSDIMNCEDYHLTVRLLYFAKKITKVNEPLYFYNRTNNTSITHTLNDKQKNDRYWCDLDIISFFSQNNVLSLFEKSISVRILNYTRYWVLDKSMWEKFCDFYPQSHKYIKDIHDIDCWHKILMYCVSKKYMCCANVLYFIWTIRLNLSKL